MWFGGSSDTKEYFRLLGRCWHTYGQSAGAQTPGQVGQIYGGGEVNISASIRAPCTKCGLKVPQTHRNISDHLGGVDTPMDRAPAPKIKVKLSKYMGEGRSISQLLLGPHAQNTFCRFLRHIGTFLDYLGGVDTPAGRVPMPKKLGQAEQIHLRVERSISQLLLGPHAQNTFCRFLRHIGTFVDHVEGVDTPAGRLPALKMELSWANAWERGGQYLSFY